MSVAIQERHPRRRPHEDPPKYPESVREIHALTWWIWIWALGFVLLSWWLWSVRIDDYYSVAAAAAEKRGIPYGYWDAFYEIMVSAEGRVPLALNIACILIMVWFWQGFHTYLVHVCEGIPKGAKKPSLDARQLRRLAALHEPAGDIFTLVGIAFTFLGLAVSMLTISAEVIQALANVDRSIGRSLAQSAIVFGSSLGIGLVGSLFGVALAVHARWIAAQCCPDMPSAWHTANAIDHLHSMPELLQGRPEATPVIDVDQLARAMVRALAEGRAFADLADATGRLTASVAEMKDAYAASGSRAEAVTPELLRQSLAPLARIEEAAADTRATLKKRMPVNLGLEIRLQLEGAVALLIRALEDWYRRRDDDPDTAQTPLPGPDAGPPADPNGQSRGRRGRKQAA